MHIVKVGNSGSNCIRNEGKLDTQKISCNFSNQSSHKCS